MVRRLTGFNPLSYLGVDPVTPAPMIQETRAPTVNDNNAVIGTFWVVKTPTPVTYELWILMNLAGGSATWVQLFPGAGGGGATTFPTDAGTANEAGGILNVFGGTGIATSGAGNTVTISSDGSLADSFPTDAGTATPMAGVVNVLGGTGCSTTGVGNTITVNLDTAVAESFPTDSGTATPAAGILNILGGTGCSTTGAGNTVTVNLDASVATTYTANAGSATPAANNLNIVGDGTTITTNGAGSTITISAVGSGLVDTLTGNSGGAIAPLAGNINVLGDTTSIAIAGNAGTHTLTASLVAPVSIANGGTNTTSFATTDGTVYFDGTKLVTTATGTSGQVLTSNGAGVAPTYQSFSVGNVFMPGLTTNTNGAVVSYATFYRSTFIPATAIGDAQMVIPFNATIDRLYVNAYLVGSTINDTVTLNVNGVDSTLVATITASTIGVYSDLTHSVVVNQGDLLTFKLSKSTTSVNSYLISCRIRPS